MIEDQLNYVCIILYSADEGNDENEDPNGTFDIAKNTTEKGDSISKSFVKEKSFSSVQSYASQDAYIRGKYKFSKFRIWIKFVKNNFEGLEKLLFNMDASFKKREASSQALIVRLSTENEQLKEDLSAVEQV